MKQKFVAKAITVFLAFVMLFFLLSFSVVAATDNVTVAKTTTQTTKKAKRLTYTEALLEIDKKLTPKQKTALQKMQSHLKNSKSYNDLAKSVVNNIFEIIDDPQNADWTEMGMETLKSVVNLFASCYGLGGVSDAIFDGVMNFGDNPQSELQILQGHLDDQFDEMHDHLDDIQSDIAELSTKVDDSTKEILEALSDALEADYAKTQVIAFMSSSEGNFNYTQFKNYLYGQTDGSENPYYYTQAYYNKLLESIVNRSSDEILKENYDALYRSIASTAQHGDSNINMFYDYLLYNEQSGKESIQRYYYEYLLSNRDLLRERNAEYEALQFTLDLYTTALFTDHCVAMCNNYQLLRIYERYGANPSADAKYVYGNGQNDYITYDQLLQNSAAIDARQAKLEAQMVADTAYILNLEGSAVIEDSNNNFHIIANSDENTFGRVQIKQTIYLNKMAEIWCDFFGFETDAFTYEWYNNNQYIGANEGVLQVSGFESSLKGVVKYRGREVYSITFENDTPTFNGGNGSVEDPYVISNAEQFNLISSTKDGLNKHYILIDNIDFEDVYFSSIGNEDKPFNGSVDGNGYAIENLEVTADEYVGLFGYVGPSGVIENLNIKKSTFKLVSNDFERVYAGAITAVNEGTIFNCYVVDSSISIDETNNLLNKHLYAYAGGVAGLSVGDISYCKIIGTEISAKLVRDYGSESDGKNSTTAYAAGIVASNAENGTINCCSVDNQTTVNARATSTCHDSFSTRHPYITVRAAGIVVSFSDISKINEVWSEAVIGKCEYYRENTAGSGNTQTNNCSAKSDPYIPELSDFFKNAIKAEKQDSIAFPSQILDYEITYSFDCEFDEKYNCYIDQLYDCNEKVLKIDNLNILINGKIVDCSILAHYNFNTINSDISNSRVNIVTIVFASHYNNEIIVDRLQLPITITENTAIGLEVSVLPNRTTYNKDESVSITGGSVVLRYQDGFSKDVTSFVGLSYDTSKYGKTLVTVTYGEFAATYEIIVVCNHSYKGTTVDPTCTKIGYTVYICEHCLDTYKTDFAAKVAHSTVPQNEVPASCTEEGKFADAVCNVCLQIVELGEAIPPTGHNYAEGKIDAGAHYCKACGLSEEHLFKTTEYETEVLCTCVICDYLAKFDANSRDKISKLPRIVVSTAYSLNGENEIVVYLELYSGISITSAEFSVYFGDELEFVSCSYGNILYKPLTSAFKVYSDHLNVSLAQAIAEAANPNYEASNTLLRLVFKTPKDAVTGKEYPIVIVNKAENKNGITTFVDKFTDATGNKLDFISVNSKIKVVDRLPGDVIGDGTVDLLDAVIISKYSVLEGADRTEFLASMKETYETFDISYGDVTLDNILTNADVVQILRYTIGGYEARIFAKDFTIKLNYNDGTGKETYISARYDENGKIIMGDLPVVERDGYRFDGWYYGFGKDAIKLEGNYQWNYDAIEQTLYAHYTSNSISFVGNGATAGKMDRITYGQMDKWTVSNAFEKTSNVYFGSAYDGGTNDDELIQHTFIGWALEADGEVVYKTGQTIDLKNGKIGNLTLYAIWSTEYVQLPELNREGFAYTEWTVQGDNVVVGKAGASFPITADISLSAKWSDNSLIKYTIVYDGNGATGETAPTSDPSGRLHSIKTNFQLVNNNFIREGYHFVGWNTEADRSGTHFENLAFLSYTYIDTEKDGVVTLYAQWEKNTYKIIFNMNPPAVTNSLTAYRGIKAGSMMDITDILYDADVTLTSNKFVVPGWLFKGWSKESTGTVVYDDGKTYRNLGAHGKNDDIVNLYAVWEVDPYAVGEYVTNSAVASDTHGENSYTVYNSISGIPTTTPAGNVIIDWSREINYIVNNNLDISNKTTSIIFVGDINKTFTKFSFDICSFANGQSLTVQFKDFNYITDGYTAISADSSHTVNLTIDVVGTCTIGTTHASGSILGHNNGVLKNVSFIGNGQIELSSFCYGNNQMVSLVYADNITCSDSCTVRYKLVASHESTGVAENDYVFNGWYGTNSTKHSNNSTWVGEGISNLNATFLSAWYSPLIITTAMHNSDDFLDIGSAEAKYIYVSGGAGAYDIYYYNISRYQGSHLSSKTGVEPSYDTETCLFVLLKKEDSTQGGVRFAVRDTVTGQYVDIVFPWSTTDGSCFTGDTQVTLADGSSARIDSLKAGDIVMSWNAITGKFEAMPISMFWNHGEQEYDVIALRFSNEKIVKIVTEHGFFDITLNKYVYIDANNYADYIGHEFAHMTADNSFEKVALISAEVSREISSCYSLRTACNDNAIVDGFLTLTHEDIDGLLTYFDFGDNYMYDEEKMCADIEKYGLFSYEEWKDYVSYEEFVALNGQYLSIAIGKGYLTYEDIFILINGMR